MRLLPCDNDDNDLIVTGDSVDLDFLQVQSFPH